MNNHSISYVPFFGVTDLNQTPFKVFEIKNEAQIVRTSNRRGFYKICLITGNNIIRYAKKEIQTEGANLFFCNAYTTYEWEFISEKQKGYGCILTADFLKMFDYLKILQQLHLFASRHISVFSLNDEQKNFIANIFHKMISEQSTNYIFKYELMHTWISLVMHEALKIKSSRQFLSKEAHHPL